MVKENRKLTTVFYLNDDWKPEHGGRLKMYDLDDNELATLDPKAGRLVFSYQKCFHTKYYQRHSDVSVLQVGSRTNGVTGNQLDIAR